MKTLMMSLTIAGALMGTATKASANTGVSHVVKLHCSDSQAGEDSPIVNVDVYVEGKDYRAYGKVSVLIKTYDIYENDIIDEGTADISKMANGRVAIDVNSADGKIIVNYSSPEKTTSVKVDEFTQNMACELK